MASSFVRYKNNGFWVRDPLLECIAAIFFIVIRDKEEENEWLINFQELMLKNALGYFYSHMHFSFDDLIINESRKKNLLDIFNQSADFLAKKGSEINFNFIPRELNISGDQNNDDWNFTVETRRLLKILFYLELLIYEKLTIDESDILFYDF